MPADGLLYTVTDAPQVEVLEQLRTICFPDAESILDPTYGRGGFWPQLRAWGCDLDHTRALHVQCDYEHLPFADQVFDLAVFDPPFQPRTSSQVVGKTERGFTTILGGVAGVEASVRAQLRECWRIVTVGLFVQ